MIKWTLFIYLTGLLLQLNMEEIVCDIPYKNSYYYYYYYFFEKYTQLYNSNIFVSRFLKFCWTFILTGCCEDLWVYVCMWYDNNFIKWSGENAAL